MCIRDRTYTVQRNDNLTEIANRFGTTVAELVRLNNIANPNLIYPGQVLIIRENGGSVTPPSGATTYTVQRNDNLTEICHLNSILHCKFRYLCNMEQLRMYSYTCRKL